jgi:glycosyltransferase involved in cell wall biosynthesis
MRILIANSYRSLVGGVEKYLQVILPRLAVSGHTLGFLYEFPAASSSETIDRDVTELTTWCVTEQGQRAALVAVDRWRPQVVYAHGLEDGMLQSALQRRYPYLLYAHNYDGTCATGRKCHMFPLPQPCQRKLGPACVLLHYPRRCGGLNPVTVWRQYRRQIQLRSQLEDCRMILVASAHMQQELLRNGISPKLLRLVPLPPTEIAPECPPPSSGQPGSLLFLGRLTDLKGGGYLINAMPRIAERLQRNFTLTIAGDGPDRTRLQELAHARGVRAEFLGWVNSEQKLELMRRAELLVVPSVWPEPFGLVGVEAACTGLPAVGYAVGGILDWLIPGCSGEVAPGDPPTVEGLVEAIVRALIDPVHYARLRDGAWKQARKYTVERHLFSLESLFDEIVHAPVGAVI